MSVIQIALQPGNQKYKNLMIWLYSNVLLGNTFAIVASEKRTDYHVTNTDFGKSHHRNKSFELNKIEACQSVSFEQNHLQT